MQAYKVRYRGSWTYIPLEISRSLRREAAAEEAAMCCEEAAIMCDRAIAAHPSSIFGYACSIARKGRGVVGRHSPRPALQKLG